ncbi:MAG: hypothetical protein HYX92_05165 [Chloroflexi bacterium]|nr:hypothetical protein [Chloroflexota bacterium]
MASIQTMNPVGEVAVLEIRSRSIDSLTGRTVALMDARKVNSDVFLARAEKLLKEQYGVAAVVYGGKPNSGRGAPKEVLDELGVKGEAAIVAFGD